MTKFELAFFDIDGTLAKHSDPKHKTTMYQRVPESARLAIKNLKDVGIEPIIATGRNHGMIKELLSSLNIESFIANNGRYVMFKNKKIAHDTFSNKDIRDIVDYLKQERISYCFETADHLYVNQNSDFVDDGSMELEEIGENDIPENIIQMIVRSKKTFEIPIKGIQAVKVAPRVYDITMENSNKAVGVKKMLSAMDIKKESTIAFGDEENDLEMFKSTGYTVSMGNGIDEIKKISDYVTDNVDDDGVWKACKALNLF